MNANDRYKLELNPYFVVKSEESCDFSAGHIYGKFLNYTEDDDYVGASLAKKFLQRGSWCCRHMGYKGNKFKTYYKNANKDNKFKILRKDFFYDR